MHRITKKMSSLVICVAVMVTILAGAVQVSGSVIFDDQFNDPILSPDWVINPGKGWYSLTDNPGYLRYIIDAYGWGSGAVPLRFIRPFSGDQWLLTTAITYNMRPGLPTNNRAMQFFIRAPGSTGASMIYTFRWVGVNDDNPYSNALLLWLGDNYIPIFFPNSPNPLPLERWYFELERNKDNVALRASNDGNDSTFEYQYEHTFPPGVLGNDQEGVIQGSGWYGSNDPPGYADFDFIRVVSTIVPVTIDVKPGSFPNSINLKSKGNVPVAILSSPTFDATTVDRNTIVFAGASPLPIGQSPEDVNSDGLLDVVLHFKTQDLNLQPGDTEACLSGQTLDGQDIEGCDSVRIVK